MKHQDSLISDQSRQPVSAYDLNHFFVNPSSDLFHTMLPLDLVLQKATDLQSQADEWSVVSASAKHFGRLKL
jgi:hypothetical protein